jgi:hypothetical protein
VGAVTRIDAPTQTEHHLFVAIHEGPATTSSTQFQDTSRKTFDDITVLPVCQKHMLKHTVVGLLAHTCDLI